MNGLYNKSVHTRAISRKLSVILKYHVSLLAQVLGLGPRLGRYSAGANLGRGLWFWWQWQQQRKRQ